MNFYFNYQNALTLILALLPLPAVAQSNFAVLTREHTDFRVLYSPGESNVLSLVARDQDSARNYPGNEVILVVHESSRLTLPSGTPFGDAGQPLWILPQSQNPNLLYLGISAETIPLGVFDGPLTITLKRFDGPGYFMVWQATGPGQFNIRVNTRDGLSATDAFTPLTGSHEHFNWGFSTTGVYCATFQATGRRLGETINITSAESTFLFHVQPLPPATNFLTWQKHFWPPGFNPPTTRTNSNPDGDAFDNLREYAFGLSPTNANPRADAPLFEFIGTGGQRYGALTFTRYLPALDLLLEPQVADTLPGAWHPLTNVVALRPGTTSTVERLTARDHQPATGNTRRFFRLGATLH